MRLGDRLLAEKLITQEQLQEALAAQVVHGGRLGTNLVELGRLKEEDLARVLGQLHGCPYAAGEMKPDPQALAHAEPRFMDEHDLVPMRVEATRLTVAVLNPHAFRPLEELAFRCGKRVVAVIVPEFRMAQLLRRHAGAWRPMRQLDMHIAGAPGPKQEKAADVADPPADLMSEEEFQRLYAQALDGAGGAGEREAELPLVPLQEADVVPEPTLAPVVPLRGRVAAGGDLSPLTFAAAQGELSRSSDREEVARTILRYAVSKWSRVLLLSVQGELLTGWAGLGEGVREAAVRRIGIALRGQSTFRLVRELRSHYVGPMKHDAATTVFYKLLGGGFPTTAVLLPLLVRGKVVYMLYVDAGPGRVTPPDVGELLILSQGVARSYEAMIQKRQSA